MIYGLLADMVVALHLAFVCFVLAGGLLLLRRPRLVWLHLPAVAWGAALALQGGVCPLTRLEVRWRILAGEQGYTRSFVEQYLEPVLYPVGLDAADQQQLGMIVLALNLLIYAVVLLRRRNVS